ncbi:MAG: nitric oxide synthase oxygenase, partial [Haliscomenobacter sp.]
MNTLFEKARAFYAQYFLEKGLGSPDARLREIGVEIEQTGTYYQHPAELEFGARLAWRNSNRCVG